jgi:hypothetical protein
VEGPGRHCQGSLRSSGRFVGVWHQLQQWLGVLARLLTTSKPTSMPNQLSDRLSSTRAGLLRLRYVISCIRCCLWRVYCVASL